MPINMGKPNASIGRLYILVYMLFRYIVMDLPNSSDFSMVKVHLLLLMSVIARHSEEGFRATIEAFDHYKVTLHCIIQYVLLIIMAMDHACQIQIPINYNSRNCSLHKVTCSCH